MKQIDLSVIIPIYNTNIESLRACLNSLNNVDGKWEAVLIDDGSDEYIRQICTDFSKNDSRIQYYYQTNQGASAARNKGIEKSSGKYIMFVDADDLILPFTFNSDFGNNAADLVIFDCYCTETRKSRE